MSNRPEDLWMPGDEQQLMRLWGYLPAAKIAEMMGRSETAVVVRAKRMKLPSPGNWPTHLSDRSLARALGVDNKTVYHWLKNETLPTEILYKRNTPLMAVEVNALVRWLKRPCNWIYFDANKLHPKLRAIIKRCQEQWGDRWLTTGEAGALVGVGHKAINQRINRGSITNVVRHGNWYVRRSEILTAYGVNQ